MLNSFIRRKQFILTSVMVVMAATRSAQSIFTDGVLFFFPFFPPPRSRLHPARLASESDRYIIYNE